MTSRAYLSSRADGGNFLRASRPTAGKPSRYLASREPPGPNADGTPRPQPPTQSLDPGARRLPTGGSSETAERPDLDSAASRAPGSGGEGGQEGAQHRLSPCPQETPPAIPKLSLHQTHLWFLNIAGDDYPGRVHPGLGEGLRGDGGRHWRENKTPFPPPLLLLLLLFFFFFPSVLGAELCHFLNPNQTTACDRRLSERWYVGFGVFKAKNKRGAVSQIAAYARPGV